ncbi:MAG: putative rane protein [Mycobacterium sp.]|nr:putative rane protein [Mycobacterium sp.]
MSNMRLMPTSTTGDFTTAPSTLGNVGLLAIRLGIGSTMLHFGLQKFLTFGSTIEAMRSDGWRAPAFAAFLNAGAETVGGAPTHNG